MYMCVHFIINFNNTELSSSLYILVFRLYIIKSFKTSYEGHST